VYQEGVETRSSPEFNHPESIIQIAGVNVFGLRNFSKKIGK
jgi:hypothetical protein